MPIFPPNRPGVTSRIRLRGYDYAAPGLYFLTLCINDRTHRLGTIADDIFTSSDAGTMVNRLWLTMPERFPGARHDAWCLMPNHFHSIVRLGIDDEQASSCPSIHAIMNWLKSETTVEYIRGVKHQEWPRYHQHLWLEGYYDHLIRDERDLERIRTYIESNPANWRKDGFFGP